MKILANDGLSEDGIEILKSNGFSVLTNNIKQENLVDYINTNNIEILLVRSATKVRKDLIEKVKNNLKIIGRCGVGLDNIDLISAEDNNISVVNTPKASSISVAELVMAHIFSISRFLYISNRELPKSGDTEFKKLKKEYKKGTELRGKTLGIIGFGRIGRTVAKYAFSLGMKVFFYDVRKHESCNILIDFPENQSIEVNIKYKELNDLLSLSDFISINISKGLDSEYLIGDKEFKKMKKGAVLINTSRAGVVDEQTLIKFLDEDKLRGAGLDVFENEPYPKKNVLNHPKISVTPHTGASTLEAQKAISIEMAYNIVEHFKS